MNVSHCHIKKRFDFLLWGSLIILIVGYVTFFFLGNFLQEITMLFVFTQTIFELINIMWWGLLIGLFFVGLLHYLPKEIILSFLQTQYRFTGIFRAAIAGILLDVCSHGVLVIGMQLYKKGATLGQVMAFLIASPWNSLSLTFLLIALIGFWWTLGFIFASFCIAIISGYIFDVCVNKNILPQNPHSLEISKNYNAKKELQKLFLNRSFSKISFILFIKNTWQESKMVLRWIFFGIILAACLQSFIRPELFETLFGPTLAGIGMTLFVATILEVCSEGSTPIASEIFHQAHAPGNAFAFLMAGVATDYTEIASIKDTTKSWKIALFLPLITLPQIILLSYVLQ
jgi:uncharacterized protein